LLAIRYAPSLQTLVELEREMAGAAPAAELPALVVGDPELSDGPAAGLPRLPAAAEEARRVAELFGVTPLLGAEATEARVSELLPRARVIHLATHGITYGTTADYRDSHLALAPGRAEFDGRLTVGELLDGAVPLRAELVVLSACETALGNLRESEGTVGLQRAFLSRGARSVLVSLWPVSDRATELLMGAFYREWTGAGSTLTRAEALRRAQRWLATETEYRSPRFWAAFQLVGAG
jgi:CHAT domain-containing protein